MAGLRCPRCSTVVQATRGASPVCPRCGFGSQPPKKSNGGKIAVALILLLLVAAGAAAAVWFLLQDDDDEPDPAPAQTMTQGQADALAKAAPAHLGLGGSLQEPDAFIGSIEDPFLQGLRSMQADVRADDEEFFGHINGQFTIEWGTDDIVHMGVSFQAGSGGTTIGFAADYYCGPDLAIVVFGEDSYEARPGTQDCSELMEEADAEDADMDLEFDAATINDDGTVTGHFHNATSSTEFVLDSDGRILSIKIEEDDSEVKMRMTYGALQPLELPATTGRLAASIDGGSTSDYDTNTWSYEIYSADDRLRRDEIQIILRDWETSDELVRFDLDDDAAMSNGFQYTWTGDADAFLEAGETFDILVPGDNLFFDEAFYDRWADAEVGSQQLPGPSLWLLLGAVVLLARRR